MEKKENHKKIAICQKWRKYYYNKDYFLFFLFKSLMKI